MTTKFKVGDVIKDTMFPTSETLTVLAVEKIKDNPFVENVWYFFVNNRGIFCDGLQEIIEQEGRFKKIS